jgi:sugar phosphate isomerase/epimerase
MPRLSLTSWSLHRSLGSPPISNEMPTAERPHPDPNAELQLVDLPRQMREHGIKTLEICHFHLPSVGGEYLAEVRVAADAADVELFSILIDTGDISSADEARRRSDMRLIEGWMDVAAELGVKAVRVVAGDAPPDDEAALDRSIAGLRQLAGYGRERGLQVLTENFLPLASTAVNCHRILDALDGAVGLCADIGNFPAASRVEEFRSVVGRATSIHAKASYDTLGNMDASQLHQCLDASKEAGFDGPYTLVYDRPGDSWRGVDALARIVGPYTA